MKVRSVLFLLALFAVFALSASLRAQVITPDPNLPVLYPTGFLATASQVFAQYHGPGLVVTLSDVQLRAFGPVTRTPSGPDEIEDFTMQMPGMVSANGGPNDNFNATGPSRI